MTVPFTGPAGRTRYAGTTVPSGLRNETTWCCPPAARADVAATLASAAAMRHQVFIGSGLDFARRDRVLEIVGRVGVEAALLVFGDRVHQEPELAHARAGQLHVVR